jgi:Ca2+/Na+ antiporter
MQVFVLLAGGYAKGQNSTQVASGVLTFRTLSYVAIIAFVVCCVQHYQNRNDEASRRLMWTMLAIQVFVGFATAQKTSVFAAIFVLVICANYARAPVKVRTVLAVGAIGMFFGVHCEADCPAGNVCHTRERGLSV